MNNAAAGDIFLQSETILKGGLENLSAPFGLELGKTRLKDLEGTFVITRRQGEGFTGGPVLQVIPRYAEDEADDCIILAFDANNVLDATWFTYPSSSYKEVFSAMSREFDLIDTNSPIKGSNSALFYFTDGQIALHSPLFSQEMTIAYRTHLFDKARMAIAAETYE